MSVLPPLRSLEAFRAVMRQGGFVPAAAMLGLTPSAISYRIRELERILAAPLFERRNRAAIPTDAAHRYFEALQAGFDQLEAATRSVSQPKGAEILSMHCAPSFAAQWLMPRLKRFIAAHPEFVVRLSSTPDAVQFGDEVYDLDIQYARPVPAGCGSELIAEEFVVPLASPDYAAARGGQLAEATLLHSMRNIVQWPAWFAEFAPATPMPVRGMHFDRSFMAIAAASDGLGLCLESTLIAEAEIAAGRLVLPFGRQGLQARGHRLVWPLRNAGSRKLTAFRAWLADELPAGSANLSAN